MKGIQGLEILSGRQQGLRVPLTAGRLHVSTVVLCSSCEPRILWQRSLAPFGSHVRLRVGVRRGQWECRSSWKRLAPVVHNTWLGEKKRSWAVQSGKFLAEKKLLVSLTSRHGIMRNPKQQRKVNMVRWLALRKRINEICSRPECRCPVYSDVFEAWKVQGKPEAMSHVGNSSRSILMKIQQMSLAHVDRIARSMQTLLGQRMCASCQAFDVSKP